MAGQADFTEQEWESMQWALTDAMMYASMADPGFWDTFKEGAAAAKYVAAVVQTSESTLVRELASDVKARRDPALSENPAELGNAAAARIAEATGYIAAKAPDDLDAFKALVSGAAKAAAEAAGGVAQGETEAIGKIEAALG